MRVYSPAASTDELPFYRFTSNNCVKPVYSPGLWNWKRSTQPNVPELSLLPQKKREESRSLPTGMLLLIRIEPSELSAQADVREINLNRILCAQEDRICERSKSTFINIGAWKCWSDRWRYDAKRNAFWSNQRTSSSVKCRWLEDISSLVNQETMGPLNLRRLFSSNYSNTVYEKCDAIL